MTNEMIKDLENRGFNRWTKGNLDRLYINASQLGLVCSYYNSGNISSATFCGVDISNCEARRLKASKTFIDLTDNTIHSDSERLSTKVAEIIGCECEKINAFALKIIA